MTLANNCWIFRLLKCTHVFLLQLMLHLQARPINLFQKKSSKVPQSFSRFHCILKISRSCHFLLLLLKVFWKTKIVDYENMKPHKISAMLETNFLRQQDDPFGIVKHIRRAITAMVSKIISYMVILSMSVQKPTTYLKWLA